MAPDLLGRTPVPFFGKSKAKLSLVCEPFVRRKYGEVLLNCLEEGVPTNKGVPYLSKIERKRKKERTKERKNERAKERKNERTKERKNERTKERKNERTKERKNERTKERKNERTKERNKERKKESEFRASVSTDAIILNNPDWVLRNEFLLHATPIIDCPLAQAIGTCVRPLGSLPALSGIPAAFLGLRKPSCMAGNVFCFMYQKRVTSIVATNK